MSIRRRYERLLCLGTLHAWHWNMFRCVCVCVWCINAEIWRFGLLAAKSCLINYRVTGGFRRYANPVTSQYCNLRPYILFSFIFYNNREYGCVSQQIMIYGYPFHQANKTDITLDKQYNHTYDYVFSWPATMDQPFEWSMLSIGGVGVMNDRRLAGTAWWWTTRIINALSNLYAENPRSRHFSTWR